MGESQPPAEQGRWARRFRQWRWPLIAVSVLAAVVEVAGPLYRFFTGGFRAPHAVGEAVVIALTFMLLVGAGVAALLVERNLQRKEAERHASNPSDLWVDPESRT